MRCLNNVLEDFFYAYAGYVSRYAYVFIFVPVCMTGLLATGFYFKDSQNLNDTEYVFTPTNGRAKYERRAFDQQFPLDQDNYVAGQSFEVKRYTHVIITGRGPANANLMRNDILDEIDDLNQYLLNKLTVQSYDGLYRFFYRDICLKVESACFDNGHVGLLRHRAELEDLGHPIRYPVMRLGADNPLYVGGLLGAVQYDPADGRIREVGAIRLIYNTKNEPSEFNYYSIQFRDHVADYLLAAYPSRRLDVTFGNDDSLNQGLKENTIRFAPEIGVTIALVLLFAYLCSYVFHRGGIGPSGRGGYLIDWVRSKPTLAVVGTLEPGMAIVSAIGFLLLVGAPYNDMVIVMPFLVFAIGVDDMFIQIASWHCSKFEDNAERRFAEALSESAVAITITSVTDIISFAVGTWNPLPAMQIFCYYTATAMFFELIYQCTFYSAALYLLGRAETRGLHCVTLKKAMKVEDTKTTFQRLFCTGTQMKNTLTLDDPKASISHSVSRHTDTPNQEGHHHHRAEHGADHFTHRQNTDHELGLVQKFFRNYYSTYLLHPVSKFLVALAFFAYIGTAIWGSVQMQNGLQPEKLVSKKHYVYYFLWSDRYWNDGLPLQVLVNNPQNLSDYETRRKIFDLVGSFENTRHTMNANFTMFFLREYTAWLEGRQFRDSPNATQYGGYAIRYWLRATGARLLWNSDIRWGNASLGQDPDAILAFRFSVGLKDYSLPPQHQEAVALVREIGDRYPEFNVTSYQAQSPYVDQYLVIYPTTVRNTVLSLAIMIFVALLLIPHPVCGVFMTASVVSIDVGVSGYLYFWGVNMDCISMVTMIMATGFAVDLSAHVSYAYVRAEGAADERAVKSLETLGWPVFQGVTATLLGVLVMGTVDAYIISTFFKTVVLVIVFGLLHSIVFLPVALTLFVRDNVDCCRKFRKQHRRVQVAPRPLSPADSRPADRRRFGVDPDKIPQRSSTIERATTVNDADAADGMTTVDHRNGDFTAIGGSDEKC